MYAMKVSSSSSVVLRSSARKAVCSAPLRVRMGAPRPSTVSVRAEESDISSQATEVVNKAVASAQDVWEKTADAEKPAIIIILLSVVVAQICLGATMDVIDKLPFIGDFMELIGLAVAATYGYKYVTDPAERASVKSIIDDVVAGVTGK